ncbi:tellurite resistance/C4-dicarboxylate transporter family protein [Mycolicibacterium sp. XJ1819]
MATGIVSIAAADHGYVVLSDALAVLAAAGLPLLLVAALIWWARRPPDLTDPDVTIRLFTFVAACAVLDSRLTSNEVVVWTLSLLASAAWLVLVVLTSRNLVARSWRDLQQRAGGAWELASVGTSGLAIVAAALARHTGADGLLIAAVVVWVFAIAVYALMTTLILARAFEARLDPHGFQPDAWILMGALAIATLAGDHIHRGGIAAVRGPTTVTWALATLWIVPLLYFGVRHLQRPESRRFAGVWWAMVFPLGMYSSATFAMARETDWQVLVTVSLVFFWVAFATWLAVTIAGVWMLGHLPSKHGQK